MHICLISREYPTDDHMGGIGTYTEKTARGLARLGQTVYVITEAEGAPSTRVEDGVVVMRLAPPQTRPRLVARARAVARALTSLPRVPDIVQACEYRAEAFWYALRKPARTKLITRLATPSFLVHELMPHAGANNRHVRFYYDPLERLQARRSDVVYSITDALADIVCERWGMPRHRVPTIRTGVDFAERYGGTAAELPTELRDKEYLLYFGRLEERKGVHILARALPQVLAAYPQVHVVFAGNMTVPYMGLSMRSFIERCNEGYLDRLHFFDRLPQPQLYPILAHSLLAVLPSLWEAMGNVSLEALDMGKPVVATLGSGFGEVIEHGRSGVLVPPGDVDALGAALQSLLADRDRLSRMSEAARARASYFNLGTMTQRLLDFYEALHRAPAGKTLVSAPVASDVAQANV